MTRQRKPVTIPPIGEAEFQAQVVGLAKLCGWRCYHVPDSRRCDPGYPDWHFVRRRGGAARSLIVELKRQDGETSDDQDWWIEAMRLAGLDVRVWRPSDWDEIKEALR